MSIDKDLNLPVSASTLATGAEFVAYALPTGPGTALAGVAEILKADVKRSEMIEAFSSQIAALVGAKPSEVTAEFIESHRKQMPDWFMKEWDSANDVTGKTSDFFVSMVAGLAGMALGSMIPVWGVGMVVGFALGYFASDIAMKEFRNARGEVGGVSSTNLAKVLKQEATEVAQGKRKAVDETLTAVAMLIQSAPDQNTEELENMVLAHLDQKQMNPRAITDLDAFIHGSQEYLFNKLGTDVQSLYPEGTQVQDIIAKHVQNPAHVDALLWKSEQYYQSVASNVHKQHLETVLQQQQLAQHGKAILNSDGVAAPLPPSSVESRSMGV